MLNYINLFAVDDDIQITLADNLHEGHHASVEGSLVLTENVKWVILQGSMLRVRIGFLAYVDMQIRHALAAC